MNVKPKIVFFDMEGTLFSSSGLRADGSKSISVWPLLTDALGSHVTQADFVNYQKWKRGEYESYIPWMEDTSTLLKQHGLTKDIFDRVITSSEYFPGVDTVMTALHAESVRTAVITGGFYEQAERTLREHGIHHARASCRYFWHENGALSHWELEEHGLGGKVEAAEQIAAEYGVFLDECAFVGDGDNDIYIASAVGMSVAFNGMPELQNVTTYAVNQPEGAHDFSAVLEYLLPYEYTRRIATARAASV